MASTHISTGYAALERAKRSIERLIWPDEAKIDTQTETFFIFRPFPKGLSAQNRDDWVALQVRTNAPFINCSHYCFVSTLGAHIWYATNTLNGLPETAAVNSQKDGECYIKGQTQCYRTKWQKGVMTECTRLDTLPENATAVHSDKTLHNAWGLQHKLDVLMRKPTFWTSTVGVGFVCALLWATVGHITITIQSANTESARSTLENTVGELLDKQASLRQYQQQVTELQNWKGAQGFFPDAYGLIATSLNEYGNWNARRITWQDKTLTLEVQKPNLDITTLVTQLENTAGIQSISIRPHNEADTWVLEATFI
ncbi:hypothetical protein [Aestuariibacter salexigens]|uniref:hypothetical protein n=1 Tax=Aestuariibacter salexigens TaxID=226010 RepID=UPI000400B2D8|nr:hypothetical protein [Aestuariibacter salexigens]